MPLPKCCPKCRSVRWNRRYLDEELALIDKLPDELYETGRAKKFIDAVILRSSVTQSKYAG
jgi:hypothetical protein